jgi:hypothetical protein
MRLVSIREAAESVPAQNTHIGHVARWMYASCRRVLLQCPVRPVRIVVVGVFAQDQPQVPLAGDQHPVQALAAGAGDPVPCQNSPIVTDQQFFAG